MIRNGPNGRKYWRCDQRGLKCKGSAVTEKDDTVKLYSLHNHDASEAHISVKLARTIIKEEAMGSFDNPQEIVSVALGRISDSAKEHLPSLNSLRKQVSRVRKSTSFAPARSLTELHVPETLFVTDTSANEKFLLGDSGKRDDRVLVFASDTDIVCLSQCSTWIMDGTFKTDSVARYHLWVIYGVFYDKTVPLVYSLLLHKEQSYYERAVRMVFAKIEKVCPGMKPECLFTDFRKPEEDAFKRVVQGLQIRGCYFHFSRSIWQKIKDLGLVDKYNKDQYFRTMMNSFSSLAFVPLREVVGTYEALAHELVENLGEEEVYHDLLDYLVKSWVGRKYPKRTAVNAIHVWNCNGISPEELPATTSLLEMWHYTIQAIYKDYRNNPYQLIEKLLEEQARVDYVCTRLESGEDVKWPACNNDNVRLLDLIRDFKMMDIGNFLSECGHYVHYF